MSISTEILRLQTAKSDLKTAIEAKGVTVPSATTIDGYASLIGQISQGVQEAPENDVNFYDYDGFRVASFTIAEAKALTQAEYNAILPPTHEGLTFQEWNWTLNDIATYNRQYINIGANYVPTDGKTHIRFSPQEEGCYIGFRINISEKNKIIVVDWGDGNSTEYYVNTDGISVVSSHNYSGSGIYDIKIYSKNADTTFKVNILNNITNGVKYIEEINTSNEQYGMEANNFSCLVTLSKYFTDAFNLNRLKFPLLSIPRGTQFDFSGIDLISNTLTIISFPKIVPSFLGTRVVGTTSNGRLIIPEVDTGGTFSASSIGSSNSNYILSLPNSLQWSSAPPSNVWSYGYSYQTIDIVQGWVPNYSISFSASVCYTISAIVDFFNKLGTTTNAITLTFGSTNLNKLTADQKAIATNKGYTLA